MPEHLVKLAFLATGPADQVAKRELDCQPEGEAYHGVTPFPVPSHLLQLVDGASSIPVEMVPQPSQAVQAFSA